MRVPAIILPALLSFLLLPAASFAAERQTLAHGGLERTYILRIPPQVSATPDRKSPLVVVLHGGGGNGANAERMTGFTEKAAQEGFIVVYPEGTSGVLQDRLLTWNAGHCCGAAMRNKVDDVGFIGALIDHLADTHPVDPARVYVTGLSNGGMMAHRIGIEIPEKVAAIAPVISGLFGDETRPQTPVSAIIFNGALDHSVPVDGGQTGGKTPAAWDGTPLTPAEYQAEFWAKANGCRKDPRKSIPNGGHAAALVWQYDCPENAAVTRYLALDTGHAWPGGKKGRRSADEPGDALDATALMWDFFRDQRKMPPDQGR